MTRRLWLQGLVVGLWSQVAAGAVRLADRVRAAGGRFGPAPVEAAFDSLGLTTAEMDTLLAFGEVLVEGRTLSAVERSYLVRHIEESARARPDQRVLYRSTASLLDRLAGGRFALLGIGDRVALVSRHRLDARGVLADEEIAHLGPEAWAVRTRVVPSLINGYWRSPAGWAAVGYGVFPGRCGDLTRYTRPEP
jgi:hypothetical protein